MANLNINKVILGGHITADMEMRTTTTGVNVVRFQIAIKRKNSKENETDFINCIAWRGNAEFVYKYFKKGDNICIAGAVQTRTYDDKDKKTRTVTEILVEEAYFVSSKNSKEKSEVQPKFEEISVNDMDLPF